MNFRNTDDKKVYHVNIPSVIFILLANILIQCKHSLRRDDWQLEVQIVGWRLFINQKKKKFKKKNFKKKKIASPGNILLHITYTNIS